MSSKSKGSPSSSSAKEMSPANTGQVPDVPGVGFELDLENNRYRFIILSCSQNSEVTKTLIVSLAQSAKHVLTA